MHGYEKLIYEYKSTDVFVKYLIEILNVNIFIKSIVVLTFSYMID